MITPYDVICMKNHLGISSDEFLREYTTLGNIAGSELPVPVIKLLEGKEKSCPFLGESGCTIYEARPVSCRYYPIGAGLFHNKDAKMDENFFAFIKEDYCLGHDMGEEMTVQQWRENQGVIPYDEVNSTWTEIILKRKSMGPFINLPEKTLQMFFMGCYNIDSFRRFIFNSKFLEIYIIPDERAEQIKEDDVALLYLAYDWLKSTLYGEGLLEIKEMVISAEEAGV